jgi:type IV secretory pathway TrbF-like protein
MFFKRTVQRYGDTPAPITPYQHAAQVWDERIGSARVQASNWRLTAFGALSLAVILSAGMIWQSSQSRVTPYVVEVDMLGEARAITPAEESFKPTEAQTAWYIGRFITNVRSLSTDPVVVRQNWLQAYDFTTDHGAAVLNEYARASDPFANVGAQTVSVQVTSVVKAPGSTYQVRWTEQTYKQGNLDRTSHWTAMVTVVSQSPRTVDVLRKNPLGIYVNGLDWSEEINAAK